MDFRKLQAFCKVYELRSFSKAGQALFLSQPTISAHIQGLEQDLGAQLFDRLGRSVMPTGPAHVLYPAAIDVFRRLDLATGEIDLIQKRVSGDIAIGGSTIPAHWILPGLLADFCVLYPEVTYSMSVGGTSEIIDRVASGELEVGMVGADPKRDGMEAVPVMDDEIIAVARPSALQRIGIGSEPLEQWAWILRESNCGTRLALEQALGQAGTRVTNLRVALRVESTHAVLACAKAGLGVGVTSRLAAEPEIETGELVRVDLGLPPIKRFIYLIHLQGRSLFPAARAFIEVVSEQLNFRG
ncbi:MAG: LysR family transcriptional regulator [Proteobacteria bacterium]|nr:LysR family transcriptional regulator [Pseudomonadota bacterium]